MTGPDSGSDSVFVNNYPDQFRGGDLVGVNGRGAPVYFDPSTERAFEVTEDGDELVSTDFHWDGTLSDIIDEIEDAIGWDQFTDYGLENQSDD